MTGFTARLAEFVAAAAPADPARDAAATAAIVDSIGVICAGLTTDVGQAVLRWAGAPAADDPLWTGAPAGCPPESAAMVAAAMGHALDFDDVLPGAGHPSNILLSAILAAPGGRLPGRRLLDAFVVGYEVNARVARAVGHRHYLHGWHTTSTAGVFGAAAAAAVVLQVDAAAAGTAFGIAASLAGGLQRNFGTMTKPLHAGLAARHGVLAAQLAAGGFTADEQILDGERSFVDVYSCGAARPEAFDGLGEHWAITDPGPTLKLFPAALEVYRAVEGVLILAEENRITADQVVAVRCAVPPGTLGPLRHDRPRTGLEGKFSMPYTVAAALLDGGLQLDTFTDEAVHRPEVTQLMERVTALEDPRTRPEDPSGRNSSASFGGFVDVTIDTTDHRSVSTRVHDVIGSPRRPLTPQQREEKFRQCLVAGGRDGRTATDLYPHLAAIAGHPDVHQLLQALAPSQTPPARTAPAPVPTKEYAT
jgi:2-methylcitrate dehydratase PrpD